MLLIAEHSPPDRRGYWASYPQSAACIGNVLASIVLFGLSSLLPRRPSWIGAARGLLAVRDHRFRRLLHSPFGGGRADFRGILAGRKRRAEGGLAQDALAAYPGKTFSILLRVGETRSIT